MNIAKPISVRLPVQSHTKLSILALALLLVISLPSVAAGDSADALFDENSLFGGDNGDSGSLFVESGADDTNLAEQFMAGSDPVVINGSIAIKDTYTHTNNAATGIKTSNRLSASGVVTADVRPSMDYRLLLKADYTIAESSNSTTLREGFVDTSFQDIVFVRAGRQTLHWGTGVYFSPADLISNDALDAADPEADRIGTNAIKIHRPNNNDNYYVYLIPNTQGSGMHVAGKGEWMVNDSEVTLALVDQVQGATSVGLTIAQPTSWGKWYGEYVLSHGVTTKALDINMVASDRRASWLQQATLGGSYTVSDSSDYNISASGQYYYNGQGYDVAQWRNNSSAWVTLMATGEVDTRLFARQYMATSIRWSGMYDSKFSSSWSLLKNLTDQSHSNTQSLSYQPLDELSVSIRRTQTNSLAAGQYSPKGPQSSYSDSVSMWNKKF